MLKHNKNMIQNHWWLNKICVDREIKLQSFDFCCVLGIYKFQGAGLFHAAEILFSNEKKLKHQRKRSIPTPSDTFTSLDQKFRAKRQIKSTVIFMPHLEVRFFHLPYSSKQAGHTGSSPVLMGSPCSWHRVLGFEGHCFALLPEKLHFSLSYVTHRIFQAFRSYRDRGHRQAAGGKGTKAQPLQWCWGASRPHTEQPPRTKARSVTRGEPLHPGESREFSLPSHLTGFMGQTPGLYLLPSLRNLVKGLSDWEEPGGYGHM